MSRPRAWTIAGSDPSGGAGIQADLRTFAAMSVTGCSVITALTAQNSHGVQVVCPVQADVVAAQLHALLDDGLPDAIKLGMLGSSAQVEAVADVLSNLGDSGPPIVLDPVLAATSGAPLLDDAGRDALIHRLVPLAALVTPNRDEAARLTGIEVDNDEDARAAAERLIAAGARAVLVKGGHRSGDPIDILVTGSSVTCYPGSRIETPHTHGTGCFLSSAIAAGLARGMELPAAVGAAKSALALALRTPVVTGGGRGYPALSAMPAAPDKQLVPPTPSAAPAARIRGLYVITDPVLRPDRSAEELTSAALQGGACIIQLRDKHRSTPDLIVLARRLRSLAHAAGALLIVNDRVDVALASDADGVHLGPADMAPVDARRILGPEAVIGVSVSTVAEAALLAPFATYLGVGAIFGTSTKADAGAPVGVERIREIKAAFSDKPVVAIGGIDTTNIGSVAAAGAASAAVISAVLCAPDMSQAARQLVEQFEAFTTG
ncbi:MAG: bifunctional hydroxymethylpyrimidine kinase/phosphomethylpyrimidine kinase [Capsulimonadaceae bacterium]